MIKPSSLQEFLQRPETQPASEYINGQVLPKPMPLGKQSILQGELVIALNSIAKPQHISLAFLELRCTFGGQSIVPDVAVFRWERLPRDENGEMANLVQVCPDWVIEISAPQRNQTRITGKILHCLQYGCQLGWLIDLEERSVLIYPPKQQPEILTTSDPLPVPDWMTGLNLTVDEVFQWLKP